MSAVVWANVLLAVPVLIAFIAVPLRMTLNAPHTDPDHWLAATPEARA